MTEQSRLFESNHRAHIGLAVRDVDRAVSFYETLLGVAPCKRRPGYAKFEPEDPSLNLSLNEVSVATGASFPEAHFGLQVHSTEAVKAAQLRFEAAGIETETEEATACCYAVQDKVWASDPDGHRWEVFVVLDPESDVRSSTVASACCPTEDAGCCETPSGCCA